jgi:hypothetical protein
MASLGINLLSKMLCLGLRRKTGFAITLDSNSTADWSPMSYGFFESPHRLAFHHNLLRAVHFVLGQANDGGIRNICSLQELCQLDRFVATSYGAQRAVAANIEKAIQQFGQEERARLAKEMSHRDITLCEDETLHPPRFPTHRRTLAFIIRPTYFMSSKKLREQPAFRLLVKPRTLRRASIRPRQHQARDARKDIGQGYHPFDLKTGASRKATEVESRLNANFDTLSCDRGCLDESTCCELLPFCCRESLQRLKRTQTV